MVATNKRVIKKTGILSAKTDELKNEKIESISFDQGIIGRLLGYGDIYFSGTGTTKLEISNIKEPLFIKSKFEEIIEKKQISPLYGGFFYIKELSLYKIKG